MDTETAQDLLDMLKAIDARLDIEENKGDGKKYGRYIMRGIHFDIKALIAKAEGSGP